MKTSLYIIFILASLGTGTYMLIPKTPKPQTTEVSVIFDMTDSMQKSPPVKEILSLYDFSNPINGGIFHFSRITDLSLNSFSEKGIPIAQAWQTNELARKKATLNFKNSIIEILSNIEATGRKKSTVYVPIANALNELSKSQAEKKTMLIYSDLMENTASFSLYRPKDMNLMKLHPERIQTLFARQNEIPNLTGITVYLLYAPLTPKQDKEFQIVSTFYKTLLESKGATVYIQTNIQ